jgi:hypothetical protein
MSIATQSSFAAALLDRNREIPQGVVAHSSARPAKRFGIYRNNVVSGLVQALSIRYPATQTIVGEDFFGAMAKAYIEREPPGSPVLLQYGASFAGFVAAFAPAQGVPYLADVVRLENARVEAYHAIDIAPLMADAIAAVAADGVEGLKVKFHPSFALVRSAYPIVTIWAMNAGEAPLAPITDWSPHDALVVRPRLNVLTRRLPPGGARFLEALAMGETLMTAGEAALGEVPEFDLAANLAGMVESGLVIHASQS